MGLEKNVQTQYNVGATYWRITRISENFDAETSVWLSGYIDQASRDSGALPIHTERFNFDLRNANRALAYLAIKNYSYMVWDEATQTEVEFFPYGDAIDVLEDLPVDPPGLNK